MMGAGLVLLCILLVRFGFGCSLSSKWIALVLKDLVSFGFC